MKAFIGMKMTQKYQLLIFIAAKMSFQHRFGLHKTAQKAVLLRVCLMAFPARTATVLRSLLG